LGHPDDEIFHVMGGAEPLGGFPSATWEPEEKGKSEEMVGI
jgi:hypothetical protein